MLISTVIPFILFACPRAVNIVFANTLDVFRRKYAAAHEQSVTNKIIIQLRANSSRYFPSHFVSSQMQSFQSQKEKKKKKS